MLLGLVMSRMPHNTRRRMERTERGPMNETQLSSDQTSDDDAAASWTVAAVN